MPYHQKIGPQPARFLPRTYSRIRGRRRHLARGKQNQTLDLRRGWGRLPRADRLAAARRRPMTLPSMEFIGRGCRPDYGIIVVVWPGLVTVMTPAQLHMQVETLSSAG